MKFSIKDFFNECDQIRSFLRIWSYLLKKSLMENYLPYLLKFLPTPVPSLLPQTTTFNPVLFSHWQETVPPLPSPQPLEGNIDLWTDIYQ